MEAFRLFVADVFITSNQVILQVKRFTVPDCEDDRSVLVIIFSFVFIHQLISPPEPGVNRGSKRNVATATVAIFISTNL